MDVATVLAFWRIWLRQARVGLPIGTVLGPTFLLLALAVVIGRMEGFGIIAAAAIALGILEEAINFDDNPRVQRRRLVPRDRGALLVQPPAAGTGRVGADQVSTWQAAREVRPIRAS